MTKPSIVFAHELWADGSCFSKLIPKVLQAEGYEVMADLSTASNSLATDVAAVKACLARVQVSPLRSSSATRMVVH